MPISPQVLEEARKYRASAIGGLLESYYPTVHRLAHALCGEEAAARRAIDRVMARALPAILQWRDDTAGDRWFYHYTVLETRRYQMGASPGDRLELVEGAAPAYVAFVRALRGMPVQQREAIVLHHGEHLNPRFLGIAMDCSADAAANHLRAATLHLEAMSGGELSGLLESFAKAYRALAPPAQGARAVIRRRVRRYLLPRRLRRWALVMLAGGVAIAIWRWRR